MSLQTSAFTSLKDIAANFRSTLEDKKYILLFAYNGTGKTRLSMDFKDIAKEAGSSDTLYFNAFTEDLFNWDNDLEGNIERKLKFNRDSQFFDGLSELEMENRIGPILSRYADFNFLIDYDNSEIIFFRDRDSEKNPIPIKISRGEESNFIWCFFVAIVQLAIDKQEAYTWVKYIYVDDPISSLDDNNAIAVASHLAQLLKSSQDIKCVISSHHTLFFNVMCNELGKARKYFFNQENAEYTLLDMGKSDTPMYYHIAMLIELNKSANSGRLYTYHFNILRNIMEKAAAFHGLNGFKDCIKKDDDDIDGIIHGRIISLLNHGNYSLFEPKEMIDENKEHFKNILNKFTLKFPFNNQLLDYKEKNSS